MVQTKWIFLLILFCFEFHSMLFLPTTLVAQPMPKWVRDFILNDNAVNYSLPEYRNSYVGIGTSVKSQEEADEKALLNFARNVEVKVKQLIQLSQTEENLHFSEKYKHNIELRTDISLRGITIAKRFFDANQQLYYALVLYKKDEYDRLVKEEIDRQLLRDLSQLKKEQEYLEAKLEKLKSKARLEEEIERQDSIEVLSTTKRFKERLHWIDVNRGGLFTPNYFYNGAYTQRHLHGSFNPFSFEPGTVSAAITNRFISFQTNVQYQLQTTMTLADASIHAHLIRTAYKNWYVLVSFGINGYVFLPQDEVSQIFENGIYDYSPAATFQVLTSAGGFSELRTAIDKRLLYFSITTLPFINNNILGHDISVSAETVYRFNKEIYTKNNHLILTNLSINLQFTPKLTSSISLREFNSIIIGVKIH